MTLKNKSLQKGREVPWRLETEILPAACFHPHLQQIRVRLKV